MHIRRDRHFFIAKEIDQKEVIIFSGNKMTVIRKFTQFLAATSIMILAQSAVAQELKELNLPQSGLTEDSLQSLDRLRERYWGLSSELESYGSNFSSDLSGTKVRFNSFSLSAEDNPACQFGIYADISRSSPQSYSGRLNEYFVFSISGAKASRYNDTAIILQDYKITWPDPVRKTLLNLICHPVSGCRTKPFSDQEERIVAAFRSTDGRLRNASSKEIESYLIAIGPDGMSAAVDEVKQILGQKFSSVATPSRPPEFARNIPESFFFRNDGAILIPVAPSVGVENRAQVLNEMSEICEKVGW